MKSVFPILEAGRYSVMDCTPFVAAGQHPLVVEGIGQRTRWFFFTRAPEPFRVVVTHFYLFLEGEADFVANFDFVVSLHCEPFVRNNVRVRWSAYLPRRDSCSGEMFRRRGTDGVSSVEVSASANGRLASRAFRC